MDQEVSVSMCVLLCVSLREVVSEWGSEYAVVNSRFPHSCLLIFSLPTDLHQEEELEEGCGPG